MKVMMIAGEASGDLHGANLAREIAALVPQVRLFGMGGSMMRQAGVRLLFNPMGVSAVGLVEVLKSVGVLRRLLTRLGEVLDKQRPDVLVVIDFPEFNMRLAEMAHNRGIPVVYYISPSVWAWRRGRALKIAHTVKCVCAIFPFETGVYREAGAPVCFVGHPLLDIVKSTVGREQLLPEIGLDPQAPLFALLPGSRNQEIRALLAPMLKAAVRIAAEVPNAQFVVPLAHTVSRDMVGGMIEETVQQGGSPRVTLVEGRTYDIVAAADAAVIASGTATLEAAILGTPMVMVYKMSGATFRILRLLVKIPYVALPNIVAGRQVVPELLQDAVNPERIAQELLAIWRDPVKQAEIRAGLAESVAKLGKPGAVQRAARAVVAVARGEDTQPFSLE